MKIVKKAVDFYINSSIHLALAVYAFIRITEIYFEIPYNESVNYFIFFGTITGYNFVKYAKIAKLYHRKLTKNLRIIQVFSLFCFAMMCFYGVQLRLKTLIFCIPFTVLTILYALPVFNKFQKSLRSVPFLKIFIIALVWTGFTVIIPLFDAQKIVNLSTTLFAIQRFLVVFVLILPFDIRDMSFDSKNLQTIPQLFGIERAKKIGFALLLFSVIIEFIMTPSIITKNVFLVIFFGLTLFLMHSKMKQSKYYAAFWVESLPIFWWIFLVVFL